MLSRILCLSLALIMPPLMAATPSPPPQAAAALVEQVFDQATAAVLHEQERVRDDPERAYRLIDQLIAPHVDFELMARLALGSHWRAASPDQRRRFTAGFRESLLKTYAAVLADNVDELARRLRDDKPLLRVLPPRMQADETRLTVRTELQMNAGPLAIDYRFHASGGRWRVYDLIIMNISFLTTKRAEFTALLREQTLEQLISRMNERNRG